jgi:hypothetical protein
MRVANASGRLVADTGDGFADVEGVGEIFQTFHDNEKGQAA